MAPNHPQCVSCVGWPLSQLWFRAQIFRSLLFANLGTTGDRGRHSKNLSNRLRLSSCPSARQSQSPRSTEASMSNNELPDQLRWCAGSKCLCVFVDTYSCYTVPGTNLSRPRVRPPKLFANLYRMSVVLTLGVPGANFLGHFPVNNQPRKSAYQNKKPSLLPPA